jgi:signal transduction histidine kinase
VLQEAVSNAVKHANAQHCRVALYGVDGEWRLDVIDDGRGFSPNTALNGHGLGLLSMRERLKLVNGNVVIESKRGAGAAVRAAVTVAVTVAAAGHLVPSSPSGARSTTA